MPTLVSAAPPLQFACPKDSWLPDLASDRPFPCVEPRLAAEFSSILRQSAPRRNRRAPGATPFRPLRITDRHLRAIIGGLSTRTAKGVDPWCCPEPQDSCGIHAASIGEHSVRAAKLPTPVTLRRPHRNRLRPRIGPRWHREGETMKDYKPSPVPCRGHRQALRLRTR